VALFLAATGMAASAFVDNPYVKMLLVSVGSFDVFAALPLIWTLPTAFLSGATAAGGIAAINALGNLSGFLGAYVVGYIKDQTGSFTGALLAIAAAGAVGMLAVILLPHDRRLEYAAEGDRRARTQASPSISHARPRVGISSRVMRQLFRSNPA
jgi:ACS family tartrate transporter-like MFS transporter